MGRGKGRNVTPNTLIRIREMNDDDVDDDYRGADKSLARPR